MIKESSNAWTRNKLRGVDKHPNWKQIQMGGGLIEKDGYTFLYDESSDTILCLTRKPKTALCFRISFDLDSKSISIDLSYNKFCPQNKDMEKSHGTLIMLSAAIELIFRRKDLMLYSSILLTDNSTVDCISHIDDKSYEINLMDMNLLCCGCTWHSTIIPMFLQYENDEKQYLKSRENILTCSWAEMINNMPLEAQTIINETIVFENEDSYTLPAHVILSKITYARIHCVLFNWFMSEFLKALGAESVYGKPWIIPMHEGKIVVCESDPLTKACWNPGKKWIVPQSFFEFVTLDRYASMKKSLQTPDTSSKPTVGLIKNNVVY